MNATNPTTTTRTARQIFADYAATTANLRKADEARGEALIGSRGWTIARARQAAAKTAIKTLTEEYAALTGLAFTDAAVRLDAAYDAAQEFGLNA